MCTITGENSIMYIITEKRKKWGVFFHNRLHFSISGYVFWSLFQGLAPMIWFYPLNELEISGYEAFAVLWFLPIITGTNTYCS